jgi:hypothetical protein
MRTNFLLVDVLDIGFLDKVVKYDLPLGLSASAAAYEMIAVALSPYNQLSLKSKVRLPELAT